MNTFKITIDGREVEVLAGKSVLDAARQIGLDIPTLCHLEKCGPLNTCQVCLVKVVINGQGRLVPSCGTKAVPGMIIESETEEVHEARRTALELLFSDHVGDCLSPCHRLCPLQLNISKMIREIETDRLRDALSLVRGALPLAGILGRLCHHPCEQGCRRGHWDSPAAIREMERFVTDQFSQDPQSQLPLCKPNSPHRVVIVGAGPAGLAAAFQLRRNGHHVTVADRRREAGGTLRDLPDSELPSAVLDLEIDLLVRMGVEFLHEIELGNQITIEGLLLGHDAVLIATGALENQDGTKFGLPMAGGFLRANPNTCQTDRPQVFAAGAAVRSVKQLVRAMAEGQIAAGTMHQFLSRQVVQRPEKVFSSVMGRVAPEELKMFLRGASLSPRTPCERCAGLKRDQAPSEAARCLHCDCSSSGNCALQHYGQVYGADASRFKSERRSFEQHLQPGGVIFEPGKCILCGICVKLTEMAREPLGLTFIGRGFDVRIGVAFDNEIATGLRSVAEECVRFCPTGALAFHEKAGAQ